MSELNKYWNSIQFGFVRILIAMGAGFIIASVLNPAGTSRLIGIILYNPHSLSDEFKLDETWILLGFGIGLIIFGILLYTFMYLTEYRFKLLLQKLKKKSNYRTTEEGTQPASGTTIPHYCFFFNNIHSFKSVCRNGRGIKTFA